MITALVSKKGGVGKSTTAVNLAAALAELGRKVLLIDLDSQASASLSLGVPRDLLAPSIADVLLHELPSWHAARATRIPGLELITASTDLSSADEELTRLPAKELRLREALRELTPDYDHTIIDCPAALSLLAFNALAAADRFILPVVPQYLALESTQGVLDAAARLRQRAGFAAEPLGLLLTMVDYRTRAARENVAELRARYGHLVFAVEIRVNVRLAEAPQGGETIFEHDPASTGARAHRLLAHEYLWRVEPREELADETTTARARRQATRFSVPPTPPYQA